MAEDAYIMAIERGDHDARAIIICCEGTRHDVIASSSSHSQALATLIRRANRGAREEQSDEWSDQLRRELDEQSAANPTEASANDLDGPQP